MDRPTREAFITTDEWHPVWTYYDPSSFRTDREDTFYQVPCALLDEWDAAEERFRAAQHALRDFYNERREREGDQRAT